MSTKPAPRCPGCGAEMELTEVSKHTWRYSCEIAVGARLRYTD